MPKKPKVLLQNKSELWLLDLTAKRYGNRPSSLIGLEEGWIAYLFDRSVAFYGDYVEKKLQQVDSKGHYKYTLQDILNEAEVGQVQYGTPEQLIAMLGDAASVKWHTSEK